MGGNVDQNESSFIELMQHSIHLLNQLQQDSQQQYQAPEPLTFGDLNRPQMFYRDHQNLYHDRNYEEATYHGYDEYYQESQWDYEGPYQPSYDVYQPQEPEYQEPYQLQSDTSLDDLNVLMQQMITNEQRSIAKTDEMIERWSNKYKEELDTPFTENVKDMEMTPAAALKEINLDESDEISDLFEFNYTGNKDEESFSAPIVVLNDQPSPESAPTPPQHVHIPKVQYPTTIYMVKPPPEETPTTNPSYHDYKLKILENCFSSVGFFSTNEKQWYDEPTRHTMPWFEEVAIKHESQAK